jgi:hypothetical protein
MNGNTHIQNYQLKSALFPLASKNLLEIVEDSSDYVVEAALYNATTGYWDASYTPIMNTGAPGTSIVTNWGAVKVSNTNVSFLAQLSTNTFSFQTYSGSAWSTLTAPSWPTSGLATNSQMA